MSEKPSFFMVLRDGVSATSFRHERFNDAKSEAERLANQNPGVRFFVLQSIGAAIRNEVTWEEHDDVPF